MGVDGARFFPGTEKDPDPSLGLHGLPCVGQVYCKDHAQRKMEEEKRQFG